jgi:spore maturation protein B
MLKTVLDTISTWAVPLLLAGIPLYAFVRKVKVYAAFVEGAKQGFEVAVKVIPPLVAVIVALDVLKAAGAMGAFADLVAPVTSAIGIPADVIPMILIRPLSGGGALGVVGDVLKADGPDSYAGRLVSVMAGSTETTFYVLAVYMGSVAVTRYRQALPAALVADLVGFIASVLVVRAVFS